MFDFESIFNPTTASTTMTFGTSVVTILIAILLGGIISYTYMKSNPSGYSQNFTFTMVILPAIVAIIILLIGSNIARAFSLAGAFSIIRFRSAPAIRRISRMSCSPWQPVLHAASELSAMRCCLRLSCVY